MTAFGRALRWSAWLVPPTWAALLAAGWSRDPVHLVYNLPISVVFSVLAWTLVFELRARPRIAGPWIAAWALGLPPMLARAYTGAWPHFSGHLSWAPLLCLTAWRLETPSAFRACCVLVWLQSVAFYALIFQRWGDGLRGSVVGLGLCLVAEVLRRVTRE